MKIHRLHLWNISLKQAAEIQRRLRLKLILKDCFHPIKHIAGCDIAIDPAGKKAYAGVIVYRWPDLGEVERKSVTAPLHFPYVPGFLAFREAPALLKVMAALEHEPDLLIFDGQGIAHPRGMGIAAHLGLFLDKPAIGCAKSRLCGDYREPAAGKGSVSRLIYGGRQVGAVVRTRDRTKPVFVSPGHKISLQTSVEIVLQCADGLRIPKPTREADHYVEMVKRELKNQKNKDQRLQPTDKGESDDIRN